MERGQSLLLWIAGAVALCMAAATAHATSDGIDGLAPGSPGASIYGSNQLVGLPDKAKLIFDYTFEGTLIDKPFTDSVLLDFTRHSGDDQAYDVQATIFPKTRKEVVGPLAATQVNPILLIFFQRDVFQMSNGTGGSQTYFRNAIRRSLRTPAPGSVHQTTIEVGGKEVTADEVSFQPFLNDPHRAQLRGIADKTYRVILSPKVPGGIYEIQAETPTDDGKGVMLRETYRFKEVQP